MSDGGVLLSNQFPFRGRTKILVVEPDAHLGRHVAQALDHVGYETVVASTFQQAKRSLSAERPAVVITNLRLGEFNGFHVLLRARSEQIDLAGIVISPFADSTLARDAERLGALFLVEPVEIEAVVRAVSQLVGPPDTPWPGVVTSVDRRVSDRRTVEIKGFTPERRVFDRRRVIKRPS